jgi:hypothetical protein
MAVRLLALRASRHLPPLRFLVLISVTHFNALVRRENYLFQYSECQELIVRNYPAGLHNCELLTSVGCNRFQFRSGYRLSRPRFSCFSQFLQGKCQYNTSVKRWPLPTNPFEFTSRHTVRCRKIEHKSYVELAFCSLLCTLKGPS